MSERAGRTGRFLGMPYDFRRPEAARLWRSVWNPGDRRLLVPKAWGWGYSLNLHAVVRGLLRLMGRRSSRR